MNKGAELCIVYSNFVALISRTCCCCETKVLTNREDYCGLWILCMMRLCMKFFKRLRCFYITV